MSLTPTHPLLELRKFAGLTQRQLADRVLEVSVDTPTEQYIRRAEKGLVGDETDLSSIILVLVGIISERNVLEGRISLSDCLVQIRGTLAREGMELKARKLNVDGVMPESALDYIRALIEDWYLLRRLATRQMMSIPGANLEREYRDPIEFRETLSVAIGLTGSLYAICVALALHPFVMQRFEETRTMPGDFRDALVVLGVNSDNVTFKPIKKRTR